MVQQQSAQEVLGWVDVDGTNKLCGASGHRFLCTGMNLEEINMRFQEE